MNIMTVTKRQNQYLQHLASGSKSQTHLGIALGVTPSAISATMSILQKMGLVVRTKTFIGFEYNLIAPYSTLHLRVANSKNRLSTPPPKEELERLCSIELWSFAELQSRYSHGRPTIEAWLRHYGIPAPIPSEKGALMRMYLREGKSIKAIAYMRGCTKKAVLQLLHQHHIPLRTENETTSTCQILKDHAEQLKNDPERLSTKFMQDLIGVKCE